MVSLASIAVTAKIYESPTSLIYRGIREPDNTPVIVKVLKQDYPTSLELTRYKQEYKITRSLNLEGVIKAYSLQEYQRTLVIILEDFGGESLEKLMNESVEAYCPMPLPEFLRLAIKITEILGNIHCANVIHKDINPGNIVLNPETGQVKIIDFGISTQLTRTNSTLSDSKVLEGTLAYMSPEQTGRMNRSLDYHTDFYSLGVTFYELLTGQLPFATTDVLELVHCHIAFTPVPPHLKTKGQGEKGRWKDCPKAVSDIVMKLMAKTAEERYQSAWGIKADLEECLQQLETTGVIADFPIGSQDISDKFQIPQKLYGREAEVQTLLAAFERVAAGERGRWGDEEVGRGDRENFPSSPSSQSKTRSVPNSAKDLNQQSTIEMMLVSGYSGIGKSTLVAEIHQAITKRKGYFVSGKFDQFGRSTPYLPVVKALAGLVRQLLTESEAKLYQWREKLLSNLGVNCRVIIDVIPEVELIVGKQPAVPELEPTESQNRFNLVFQKFIRVFCSKEHPLVLFLDDLQWADSATLKLIELIMTEGLTGEKPVPQYLFLIGAYRANEVTPTHGLMITLEKLRSQVSEAEAVINEITLAPLKLEHITQLIADTLHSDIKSVKPLAELVVQKTNGNPFFVDEFLKTLYAENLITFTPSQSFKLPPATPSICKEVKGGCWQWNIAEIKAMDITDNVVELMICLLKKLPKSTQQVLRLAACVGANFDLNTLSVISENSAKAVFSDLMAALQAGLILPTTELNSELLIINYKFLHDRVQQAAYALIDDEKKQEFHLQIGRLLLRSTKPENLSEKIFEIVDHLNFGVELITAQNERDETARLNLMAGQRALAATAHAAALRCLTVGMELLAANAWQSQYDLTLNLYVEAVEAAYLCGNFEQMNRLAEVVLQEAITVLDKVKVYQVKIQTCMAEGKQQEALQTALVVLKLLGISFPDAPSQSDIQRGLEETASNLVGKNTEDLLALPKMTAANMQAAMQILSNIISATYQAMPEMFLLIVLTQVNLSIKYGLATESAQAYAMYGLILCGVVGDIDSGYHYGQLALTLLSQLKAEKLKTKTLFVFNGLIKHWKEHLRESLTPLLETYQSGLETGELEYTAFCAHIFCVNSYFLGKELEKVEREIVNYNQAIAQLKQENILHWNRLYQQIVFNLRYAAATPWRLVGEAYNEEKMLPLYFEGNHRCALHISFANKFILCYLFGEYPLALDNATKAEKYLDCATGLINVPIFHFYDSLTRLALYPDAAIAFGEHALEKVAANQEKMQQWAHHAPMNFLHKFYLVEAERHRVLGENVEAMEDYDRAIAGAKQGYIQEEALANELAAKFYLAWGKEKIARIYMTDAHYCYVRWGATTKVKDLESKYPQLLTRIAYSRPTTNTHATITTTSTPSGEALDLASVMKASQAISSEIVLDKLLEKLMKILIQTAGAQFGFLILEKAGELLIEAEGTVDGQVTVLQSKPIEFVVDGEMPLLSSAIVNYVVRTKESLVLNNATREGNFTNDPYIKKYKPKSILCAPLMAQRRLSGVVYLENNLTASAFTKDRLEVLQLLSAQAAIAITNANLYSEVRSSESRLTQFLAAMPVGVSVYDTTGKLTYLNQTAQQLLDINAITQVKIEQLAETYQVYLAGTDQLYPTAQLPIVRALAGENVRVDDIELHQPSKIVPLEVSTTPIFDQTGKISYAISTFTDITERQQAQKLLADYNRTLEVQVAERTEALERQVQRALLLELAQANLLEQERQRRLELDQQNQQLEQTLVELKRTQGQLIQSEKMSSLGQMVAGVAHEINNPVSFIYGNIFPAMDYAQDLLHLLQLYGRHYPQPVAEIAEQLEDINPDFIAEDFPKLLASMQEGADRIAQIVLSLRNFSRLDEKERKRVDIHQGIDSTLLILQHRLKPQPKRPEIQIIKDYGELPLVECYPAQLNQVFMNLLTNAIDALEESIVSRQGSASGNEQQTPPCIWIRTEVIKGDSDASDSNSRGSISAGKEEINRSFSLFSSPTLRTPQDGAPGGAEPQVVIRIADNGPGIKAEVLPRIFDPFFTTKSVGSGTGLGLSISYQIVVDRHRGQLRCHSVAGRGAEFVIELPTPFPPEKYL